MHDLACLVFPNKNAVDLRAGFILIFLAIKHVRECKITMTELEIIRKEKAEAISRKSLWKARAVMARIGLITKREGYWQFSTKFSKSLTNLAEKAASFMAPMNKEKEWFLLDCALGAMR